MNEEWVAEQKNFIRGREPRILNWDGEITPAGTLSFNFFKASPYRIIIPKKIVVLRWKWHGEKKIRGHSVADFPNYKVGDNPFESLYLINDLALIKEFLEDYEKADLVVGHNVERFDMRFLRQRALFHGLQPIAEPKADDTLKIARRLFNLESNKLDYVCRYFGIEGKTERRYDDLIDGCLMGNLKMWNGMSTYCAQDVRIDDLLWDKITPWNRTGYNLNLIRRKDVCPKCGQRNFVKDGEEPYKVTVCQRYRCRVLGCGKRWVGEVIARAPKMEPVEVEVERVDQSNI